ncbi:DNA-processing protein DprA [Marinobacter sp.]|uniref:DNA-processing protein DprA n=1 Tax=Pseudomonadales TaxID=72274 RepID=UPI003A941F1D
MLINSKNDQRQMIITEETKTLLTLSMLKGVGAVTLRKIAALPNASQINLELLSSKFTAIAKALLIEGAWESAQEQAFHQIEEANRHNARIISGLDAEYPKLLTKTKDDPFLLFIKGSLNPTQENSVAIIGTREPTRHGEVIANRITEFFSSKGWSIVSGLALGCDAIAHRAALRTNGHTVAVLAHGLQTIAPAKHRALAEEILETGGALISEYRFGQQAQPQQFVKRDRTQAGLAQGVVMIQSDIKGGSLHASRAAIDYGRWLAIPAPTITDREGLEPKIQANLLLIEGNNTDKAALLKCHASHLNRVIPIRSKDDYDNLITSKSSNGPAECFSIGAEEANESQTSSSHPSPDIRSTGEASQPSKEQPDHASPANLNDATPNQLRPDNAQPDTRGDGTQTSAPDQELTPQQFTLI